MHIVMTSIEKKLVNMLESKVCQYEIGQIQKL